MPDSEVKTETTTCPRCQATLKVTVGIQAKTPWMTEREFRNVESCQSCIEADRTARIEDEHNTNRGKFFRECGLDKRYWSGEHLPAMSLDPKVLKAMGIQEDGNNAQGFALLRQWVESDYGCLFCYGVQGSGKTCAAVAATIDCVNRPHPQEVQFLTEREIIGTYSRTSRFDISLIERAFDVEVLVLDDFGRHTATRGSAYLVEQYGDIFDARNMLIGPKRKTLITSQLQPSYSQISTHFNDAAVSSRLLSLIGGNHVEFKGDDRRENEWVKR